MRYKYIYYSLLALSLSFLAVSAQAQQEQSAVGVGTRTPYSSALDLDVSNLPNGQKKGFLLPKVALTGKKDTHTISNPKRAMMVYNMQDAGSGEEKVYKNLVYVWTGQEWVPFSNLPEIRKLKRPIHFVLASKRKISIDIAKFNSQGMTLKWNAGEVYLKNVKDVKVPVGASFEEFEILTEAYYEFTGSFNFKSNANGATSVITLLQKKTGHGGWVTIADCPGRRLSSSLCICSKSNAIPAGQPSITPPIASPCDSPKVVSLKRCPNVFPAIVLIF